MKDLESVKNKTAKGSVSITAKVDGFRRCGINHSAETVTYEDGVFTAEQIEQLKSEPKLVVHIH